LQHLGGGKLVASVRLTRSQRCAIRPRAFHGGVCGNQAEVERAGTSGPTATAPITQRTSRSRTSLYAMKTPKCCHWGRSYYEKREFGLDRSDWRCRGRSDHNHLVLGGGCAQRAWRRNRGCEAGRRESCGTPSAGRHPEPRGLGSQPGGPCESARSTAMGGRKRGVSDFGPPDRAEYR